MADFFKGLFGKKPDRAKAPNATNSSPSLSSDEEVDTVFERARVELEMKTSIHAETWGLGKATRWDADLDAGTITFTNEAKRQRITAPLQVIGTLNTQDGSWLWGWDHPSVPAQLGLAAQLVREFGERHGLEALTTRKIIAGEEDAWTFSALACHLAGDQGAYRGPTGSALVFMTFGQVTISPL